MRKKEMAGMRIEKKRKRRKEAQMKVPFRKGEERGRASFAPTPIPPNTYRTVPTVSKVPAWVGPSLPHRPSRPKVRDESLFFLETQTLLGNSSEYEGTDRKSIVYVVVQQIRQIHFV